jgi:hypothetical protein
MITWVINEKKHAFNIENTMITPHIKPKKYIKKGKKCPFNILILFIKY